MKFGRSIYNAVGFGKKIKKEKRFIPGTKGLGILNRGDWVKSQKNISRKKQAAPKLATTPAPNPNRDPV
jgi:hypothetical protein